MVKLKPKYTKLPSKLSALIRLALVELDITEQLPNYIPEMELLARTLQELGY